MPFHLTECPSLLQIWHLVGLTTGMALTGFSGCFLANLLKVGFSFLACGGPLPGYRVTGMPKNKCTYISLVFVLASSI